MNKLSRTGFIAIVLIFVIGAVGVAKTSAQANNEILKRMDNHYKALLTLQAGITMDKYNSQLSDNDISQGSVWYVPAKGKEQMAIRLNWDKPLVEYLAVVRGSYRILRPAKKIAYEGTVEQAKANTKVAGPLSFLSMSRAQLVANFTTKTLGTETLSDGTTAFHVELTPKTAQTYKLAEMWVDKDGVTHQVRVVEKNDDSTTILLTGIKENESIQGSIFIIDFPKGVKPIKN